MKLIIPTLYFPSQAKFNHSEGQLELAKVTFPPMNMHLLKDCLSLIENHNRDESLKYRQEPTRN